MIYIGENIVLARKRLNLKQIDLANSLNVSCQAVSSWERNENIPDTFNLIELAKILNVSIDWLVYNN